MDRPDVTLEISDLFLAETIYSHSQQDTDAIGRMQVPLLLSSWGMEWRRISFV